MKKIDTVAILGAGTMGRGIAEVAALAGLRVIVLESDAVQRAAARARIAASLARGIAAGKVRGDAETVLGRIEIDAPLAAVRDIDFCIEAVSEDESLKCSLFAELGQLCRPDAVLASNTSSISITRLATASGRPAQVIGMHFFNPVPVMTPVEIVVGLQTSPATIEATRQLAVQLSKTPLPVKDAPGFVVNRLLMPLINEAAFALSEGVADAPTIDALMVEGCRHPMGPLTLADLIGVDVCLAIMEVLHRDFGDPKFRPCPLLRRMVFAGQLGRKAGKGFYEYTR